MLASTVAAVDASHAEPVRLSFLKGGQVDTTRAAVDIDAVLKVADGKETNIAGGFASSWRTRLAAGKSQLFIDRAAYMGPMPRQGDRVRALSRSSKPWFEVLHVDDRGNLRLVLELGEI
ncbi:MAG: hypothetical protein J0I23_28495 [Rhizobiales bacterium]|nr:hypothetical protein [Hyphomicrobiales bacterium]